MSKPTKTCFRRLVKAYEPCHVWKSTKLPASQNIASFDLSEDRSKLTNSDMAWWHASLCAGFLFCPDDLSGLLCRMSVELLASCEAGRGGNGKHVCRMLEIRFEARTLQFVSIVAIIWTLTSCGNQFEILQFQHATTTC